jgi:hypothetical protein
MPEPAIQPAAPPKRRWHQYSLRTLLLLPVLFVLVFNVLYGWRIVRARYILWQLQGYVDKDLSKLPHEESQRVDDWVTALRGEKQEEWPNKPWIRYRNRLLHSTFMPGGGWRLYVVKIDDPPCPWPMGGHVLRFYSWGRLLSSSEFGRGDSQAYDCHCYIDDEPRHGFPCLTVETDGDGSSEPIAARKRRQYYRITDDYLEFLRSEKMDGTFSMGEIPGFAYRFHDEPPDWPAWPRLLESPDPLQQLRALAAYWTDDPNIRSKRTGDKVRQRLAELAKSPDPWISEEAKVALEEAKKK